jgi:hypothetical protein
MSVKPAEPETPPTTEPDTPTTPAPDQKLYTEAELEARLEELKKTGQAETNELRKSLQLRDARDEITAALSKAGARSPELLFNSAKDSLQFDGEGKVTNAAALVEQMKRSFPEQFGVERPGSIDGGTGRNNDTGYLTKEKLSMMSANDIAKLDWQEVRRVLAEG